MENFDVDLLLRALGLGFVLEGCLWAAFPAYTRRVLEDVVRNGEKAVRSTGIFSLLLGCGLCALVSL